MVKRIFIALLLALPVLTFGNAAQPGIWDGGGTGTFSLLFPEDSAAFKKIQMKQEQVLVQLYNGYAVVKGMYWMYNTSPDSLGIKVGYPVNSLYESQKGSYRTDIYFDSLTALQVKVNGKPVNLVSQNYVHANFRNGGDNWRVWECDFVAGKTTLIEVYFIVYTGNTIVREGYDKEKYNGFVYLLETGAIWKPPIEKGDMYIQLMDGLTVKDIHGTNPQDIFLVDADKSLWHYSFTNLVPTPANNIVITYGAHPEKLEYDKVVASYTTLYGDIDKMANRDFSTTAFTKHTFDNAFDIPGTKSGVMSALLILGITLPVWGTILGIILFAVIIYRRVKRRRVA